MPVSPPLRTAQLEQLASRAHDVLVVGAGINGAASAAALAAGGAATALVDRGDFGGGTSQESSNFVWGGVKYLENFELALVWRLCRSRNELMRQYPSSVREIRFHLALEHGSKRLLHAVPLVWVGSWLYWAMGRGRMQPPRWLAAGRAVHEEPVLDGRHLKGGVEYSDACLVDGDARFVFGFVRAAIEHGAAVANYVRVLQCARQTDGLWHCRAVDRLSGRELLIRASLLLNAAGPWVDELNAANGVRTAARHLFSKGVHLVVDRVTRHDRVLAFFDEHERMFFVIPQGPCSVIGTTDTRTELPECSVTEDDRRFLLDHVNRRLRLDRPLEPADVIAERCGVRALAVTDPSVAEGQAWISLSRKHLLEADRERRSISIFGGKLTDCLNIGNEVVALSRSLGLPLPRAGQRWYGEPAASDRQRLFAEARQVQLDDERTSWLWRRYGTAASAMLEAIGRDPRMAQPAIAGTQLLRCELSHIAQSEMVVRLEDLLRRRTQIALMHRRQVLRNAAGLRETCEALAGDHAQEWIAEYFGR